MLVNSIFRTNASISFVEAAEVKIHVLRQIVVINIDSYEILF